MVLSKKTKTFKIEFRDPYKAFYSSGDKVAGRVVVEVSETTRVTAMTLYGIGCAKVYYSKGKQRCKDAIDYLKYQEVLHLDQQPTGKARNSYYYDTQLIWAIIILRMYEKIIKIYKSFELKISLNSLTLCLAFQTRMALLH